MNMLLMGAVVSALAVSACNGPARETAASNEPTATNAPAVAPSTAPVSAHKWIDSNNNSHYRVIAKGLAHPWAVAQLPNDEYLVTLRDGELLHIDQSGKRHVVRGTPRVFAEGQGGLLDVILAPDFATSRKIFLSYAEPGNEGTAGTAVGSGTLNGNQLEGFKVLYRQTPKLGGGMHFGSRLVIDKAGKLWISQGERNQKELAQDLDVLQGKLVRINVDGSVPNDNPFANAAGVRPVIWSYGHRNIQGMAMDPRSGKIWEVEHGPKGGDEINIPKAGKNYGWPIVTYGMDYATGQPYPETKGRKMAGMEEPDFVWMTSPGVSGMAFMIGHEGHPWNNSLFTGALAGRSLIRLSLDGDKATEAERLLTNEGWRIRDVRVTPDGRVLVLTDEDSGQLIEIAPLR